MLQLLRERTEFAQGMGGPEKIARQEARGKLNARQRITALTDEGSFCEYGLLAGGNHPGGEAPIPADALVSGTALVSGRRVAILSEDFTVMGGSIGHVNAAKRARLVRLAGEREIPLILILDGAGERTTNQTERYPHAASDLQLLADLKGRIPIITIVLGVAAGHGALTGMFGDFIVMSRGSAMFSAGPPLVEAAMGTVFTAEEIGSAQMHASVSGIAHNIAENESEAFAMARYFLSLLPAGKQDASASDPKSSFRLVPELRDRIPPNANHPYDMHEVLRLISDRDSLFEVQPLYGKSLITALCRMGGDSCLIVANQPVVSAGAITAEAARKATHFINVANDFGLPLVFLVDNPGVMPGPAAEGTGVLKEASSMFLAQRRYRGKKIVVTLRKAFGFGSSVMGVNPIDQQAVSLALPTATLGGIPAAGGAKATNASDSEAAKLAAGQSGPWIPADALVFDRVIDPEDMRNEIISALGL